jgi:hypothetical protein
MLVKLFAPQRSIATKHPAEQFTQVHVYYSAQANLYLNKNSQPGCLPWKKNNS